MIQTKIKMQLQLYRQQALLLKFYGRGPHIPYGVKSTGLSLLAKMQNQLEGNMEPLATEILQLK